MPRSGADAVSLLLSTPSTRYCVRLTGRLLRREDAIEDALSNKLAQRALKREADAAAAQREIENFTAEFKNAARKCFQLIDKDQGGTLSHEEIVEAVKSDKEVIKFLTTCGDENLSFLLHPPRLKKALEALDADGSGEIDVEEWETAINKGLAKRLEQLAIERERRERAALRDDAEFSTEFLNAARRCFEMIDKDESGTLEKEEIVRASERLNRGLRDVDATPAVAVRWTH